MAAPTGYIYCITNPTFKADHTYKLGYTGSEAPIDRVRKKLLQRYGTYFGTPECVGLLKVLTPALAERRLFQLLTEFNTQKEFFQADFETVIRPALEVVGREFGGEWEKDTIDRIFSEQEQPEEDVVVVEEVTTTVNDFQCNVCQFKCTKSSDWQRHISTGKHVRKSTPINPDQLPTSSYTCKFCNKEYSSRTGVWYHVIKCKKNPVMTTEETTNVPVTTPVENNDFKSLFHKAFESNLDLQRQCIEVLKQNQELQKIVLDISQKNMAKNNITIDVK